MTLKITLRNNKQQFGFPRQLSFTPVFKENAKERIHSFTHSFKQFTQELLSTHYIQGRCETLQCYLEACLDLDVISFIKQLVQFSSVAQSCLTFVSSWTAARQAFLSITNSQSSPNLMSAESVMPSSHLILCHPFLLLPLIFPSIRVFSNESIFLIRWPKYWSFSFNISPSNEYLGLISFRIDWLDLFAIQGPLNCSPTLQFKSINSSVLSFLYSPTLTSIHDSWKNHG